MTAKIKLNSASGGGSVSLQAPSNTNENRIISLPVTADGTVLTTTNPKAGNILQVLENARSDASSQSMTSGSTYEPTFLRQSITTTGSNKVLIEGFLSIGMTTSAGNCLMVGILRDGSNVGHGVASGNKRICTAVGFNKDSYNIMSIPFSFLDSPSAGTHEYHLQISHMSGGTQTIYINRTADDTNSNQYPRCISLIRCSEVAA